MSSYSHFFVDTGKYLGVRPGICDSFELALAMSTTFPPVLHHLKAISQEAPSCTLLTKDKGKVEVQAHLLSTLSPFLASLLAQAGHTPSKNILLL